MADVVRMPEVLAGVTEAAVQAWLVDTGDVITQGTPLAEIETEKAMVEFTSEITGTIEALLISNGQLVQVGEPIILIRQPGDTDADMQAALPLVNGMEPTAQAPQEMTTPPPQSFSLSDPEERLFASPIVRRLAKERKIDLTSIIGSGPRGRIVRRDLGRVVDEDSLADQKPQSDTPPLSTAVMKRVDDSYADSLPHSAMRRTIARRLTDSKTSIPHFYLMADCRVDALLELRAQINELSDIRVSVNDFIVKAAASAFADVPEANVTWTPETLQRYSVANISVAISVPGGLMTPVLKNVGALSLREVASSIRELASLARAGRIQQHELEGGSFTISNLGMFGTSSFAAIINPPQSGILAVGATERRPIVEEDGSLGVATMMTVTLSADHRAIDGTLAAEWLAAFKLRIEQPLSIIL